jgi:hypothetical protein
VDVVKVRQAWNDAICWLECEAAKTKHNGNTLSAIQRSYDLLGKLAWKKAMPYGRWTTTSTQLSQFIGTRFLSDDHIMMMTEELVRDLEEEDTGLSIRVTDIIFSYEIEHVETKLKLSPTAYKKTLLCKFKDQAKQGTLQKLYFPLHINMNHWIAGRIDFPTKTIAFGEHHIRN